MSKNKKKKKAKKEKNLITSTKKALKMLIINGCAWVWCSYILAFLNKDEIAQHLSEIAITEILGVFLVYAVKSLFENLSKYNNWPDKNKNKEDSFVPDKSNWENAKGED